VVAEREGVPGIEPTGVVWKRSPALRKLESFQSYRLRGLRLGSKAQAWDARPPCPIRKATPGHGQALSSRNDQDSSTATPEGTNPEPPCGGCAASGASAWRRSWKWARPDSFIVLVDGQPVRREEVGRVPSGDEIGVRRGHKTAQLNPVARQVCCGALLPPCRTARPPAAGDPRRGPASCPLLGLLHDLSSTFLRQGARWANSSTCPGRSSRSGCCGCEGSRKLLLFVGVDSWRRSLGLASATRSEDRSEPPARPHQGAHQSIIRLPPCSDGLWKLSLVIRTIHVRSSGVSMHDASARGFIVPGAPPLRCRSSAGIRRGAIPRGRLGHWSGGARRMKEPLE